ncbi:hypothetical protein OBBRIDRAFT_551147 [Obba rivulosa]|uniref:Uncharacterized protein n=1 Tax=Obba rivulosa TaxID=1052685 RepID=A0A8E2DK32_9APHY|nr:hypothetical protein OBBRIDRAFT_551147 [Obba rivulosa]
MSFYNATALVVDDTDPSIVYSGGWQTDPPALDPVNYYNNTLHIAENAGQWATFTFSGSGVEVYGSLVDNHTPYPLSEYVIDGVERGTYQPPSDLITPTLASNNLFFRSPPLNEGTHVLNITVEVVTDPGLFYLDYIVWTPVSMPSSVPTASYLFPTSSASPSSPQSTSPSSVTSVAGSSSSSASIVGALHTSSKPEVGSILAGGIVGGLAALLIMAVVLRCWHRRKRTRASDSKLDLIAWPSMFSPGDTGPQLLGASADVQTATSQATVQPYTMTEMTSLGPEKASLSQSRPSHTRTDTALTGTSYASGSIQHSEMTLATPLQHDDSGFRLPPPVVELPPAYTAD